MLSGLPKGLQQDVIRRRREGSVMMIPFTDDELFNEHLDRMGILFTIRGTGKGILIGPKSEKIRQKLFRQEVAYRVHYLNLVKLDYEESTFKFFKKRNYNKLRLETLDLINDFKDFFTKREINSLTTCVPPKII